MAMSGQWSEMAQDVLPSLEVVASEAYTHVSQTVTTTIEDVTDVMEAQKSKINKALLLHDFLLQVKNFMVVGALATRAINVATAAQKISEGLPAVLLDQGISAAVTSTETGAAGVHVVLASAMLVSAIIEMNRIEGVSKDVGLWLQNSLDEYSFHVTAMKTVEKEMIKSGDKISAKERENVSRLVSEAIRHFPDQAYEDEDNERLCSHDVYVDKIRRQIKKDKNEDENSLPAQIKAFSWEQREYFNFLLKHQHMQRIMQEHQEDMTAVLAVHTNKNNSEQLSGIVERYPLKMLGASHAAFHESLKTLTVDAAKREALTENPAIQQRVAAVEAANANNVAMARRKAGLCMVNMVGGLCMLSALLLGPTFPPAAVVLFAAAITINLILLRYAKDFPGVVGTFSLAKKRFSIGRTRSAMFQEHVRMEKDEQELMKLTDRSINKIRAIVGGASLGGESNKEEGLGQLLEKGLGATYSDMIKLLEAFDQDLKSGVLSLQNTDPMTDRILGMIRAVIKISDQTAHQVLSVLTDLYAVVPGAPKLELDSLRAGAIEEPRSVSGPRAM